MNEPPPLSLQEKRLLARNLLLSREKQIVAAHLSGLSLTTIKRISRKLREESSCETLPAENSSSKTASR